MQKEYPKKLYQMQERANKIVLFHVTGVAELLIQKWKEELAIDDIKNLFSIEGVVIDDKLVKKLINEN